MHSCYSCKSLAVPRVEDGSYLTEKTRLSFSSLRRMLWLVYTEHQRQCCDVAGDIVLIILLRFLNKSGESLQQWVATPIDQMWCVNADAPNWCLTSFHRILAHPLLRLTGHFLCCPLNVQLNRLIGLKPILLVIQPITICTMLNKIGPF